MRDILSRLIAFYNRKETSQSSQKETRSGVLDWFDRHFEWRKYFKNEIKGRRTIKPQDVWDYVGYSGTVLTFLIIVQMTTGILLLFYYKPSVEFAFASVQAIRNDVPYGMLYTNIHSINSKLILLLVFIHMFRIMLIGAYRGPREPQWYLGTALLALMLFSGFSGYLLPWSQQSYWACVIGTESARAIPLIGDGLVSMLRGGKNIGGATLSRFFAFHITILPMSIVALTWLHIKSVWKVGVIAPPDMRASPNEIDCIGCGTCRKVCQFDAVRMIERGDKKLPAINPDKCNACRVCVDKCPSHCITFKSAKRRFLSEPIFPHNTLHRALATVAVIFALFIAVYYLQGIFLRAKEPADPLVTPAHIKPDWYFLASYQLLRQLPNELFGLIAVFGIYFLIVILPNLDRSGPRELERRPVYRFIVIGGIVTFVLLTIIGGVV